MELETMEMVPRPFGSGPHEVSALGVDKGDSGWVMRLLVIE